MNKNIGSIDTPEFRELLFCFAREAMSTETVIDNIHAWHRAQLTRQPVLAAATETDIKTWPERIWLLGGETEPGAYPGCSEDLNWCDVRQFAGDVEYVRADLATPAAQAAPADGVRDTALAEVIALLTEANSRTTTKREEVCIQECINAVERLRALRSQQSSNSGNGEQGGA